MTTTRPDRSVLKILRLVSVIFATFGVVVGLLVLLGWTLQVQIPMSASPDSPAMKVNAAIGFVLAGFALILAQNQGRSGRSSALFRICGGLVALLGLLTLLEYLLNVDLGIDQIFFREVLRNPDTFPPGRMAPNTAASLLLLGVALFLLPGRSQSQAWAAQLLALTAGLVGLLALVGYAYGASALIGAGPYVQMPLHTAVTLILLATAALFALPEMGPLAVLVSEGDGGSLFRRLAPFVIAIPVLLGAAVRAGERAGAYDAAVAISLMAVLSMMILGMLFWVNSSSVDRVAMERREAREALAESEARFRAALDGSLDSFVILESLRGEAGAIVDFIVVDMNARAEKQFGVRRQDATGERASRVMPLALSTGLLERYVEVVESLRPVEEEFFIAGPDPQGTWVRHQVIPLGDGVAITSRDITARRRADEELRWERNFVSAVLNTAGALVTVLDSQGRIVRFNRACEQVTGYSFEEVEGRPFWDVFLLPEEVDAVKDVFDQITAGQFPNSFENFWLTKGGERRLIAWANSALVDEEGDVEFVVATGLDITERRQAERERARLAREMELLLESTDEGIYGIDLDGKGTLMNSAGLRMVGYTQDEVVGVNLHDLIHHSHPDGSPYPVSDCPIFRALHVNQGARVDDEVFWRKDGTPLPVEYSSYPIIDEGTIKGAVVTFFDITSRKESEEQIRRLNEDLVHRATELTSINRELEAFSYSVSHDLRAPLRSIDGFSLALLEDYENKLDEDGRDYLRRVRAASQRMGQLIDDLLRLSRVTRGELQEEDVDLSALASAVATELHKSSPDRQVEFRIQPGLVARGDPRLLRVVLENLIGNAWKFTSRRDSATVEFGATEEDGVTAYFVRDNGAGFDQAYAGKLFGAFQRLHGMTEYPGTGIGLATVQRIIHRHGGKAWAHGEVDKGATFYFTL